MVVPVVSDVTICLHANFFTITSGFSHEGKLLDCNSDSRPFYDPGPRMVNKEWPKTAL
jgi:hypothetical protein